MRQRCRHAWSSKRNRQFSQPLHDVAAVDLLLVANATTIMKGVRSVIQRQRFPLDIMSVCARWYIAYAISLRNLEEMMEERGVVSFHDSPLGHQAGWRVEQNGAGTSIARTYHVEFLRGFAEIGVNANDHPGHVPETAPMRTANVCRVDPALVRAFDLR